MPPVTAVSADSTIPTVDRLLQTRPCPNYGLRGMVACGMIRVTPRISIDEDEIHWSFARSSGPGGQHVNKTATAVQLRFDVSASENLPPAVKRRLAKLAGNRMTQDGELLIEARRRRSQSRNREDALDRLLELIRKAAAPPKKRKKTRPTAASRQRRLDAKKRRGNLKKLRRPPERS